MSLFASLISTTGALRAYDRSLSVIQNNVSNVDSPGYVRQRVTFIPRPFDIQSELAGGVDVGSLISTRDAYAERNVWRHHHTLGRYSQQAADLSQIESAFKIGPDAGIGGAFNRFFNSVSGWSVNPNDPVLRQVMLDRADGVARSFNEAGVAIGEAKSSADREIRRLVDRLNSLTGRLYELNQTIRTDRRKLEDPSLDAAMHATLDEIAEIADFNTIRQEDGSFSLYFGGQTPLLIGSQHRLLQADFSEGLPKIRNSDGEDVTWQLGDGALKGVIETRTERIPSYEASLNQLAQTFADSVNQTLAGGLDQDGASPLIDLFTYDETVGTARTLKTNPLTTRQLAGAELSAPGGNGNALRLAALAGSDEIDGVTFSEFYGQLGGRAGRDLLTVREGQELYEQLANQARDLRQSRSGVSLDEEAARLIEAQRAYQANAQLFAVLNSLTDELIGIMR